MLPRVPSSRLLHATVLLTTVLAAGPLSAGAAQADSTVADSAVAAAPSDRPAPADVPQPAMKPDATELTGTCQGQRFIGQRVACYSDRAVQSGDPSVCFEAPDPDVRWPCVAKYAVVAGDAQTCRLLPGPTASADPSAPATGSTEGEPAITVDLCLSTLALVYRRPELCAQLRTKPMDDACLAKLVANGADPALCQGVKSPELREVCRPDPLQEIRE